LELPFQIQVYRENLKIIRLAKTKVHGLYGLNMLTAL